MIDVIGFTEDGMQVADTQVRKAANVLNIQIGSLEYAPDFGIDLGFFLKDDLKFQNEGFRSYMIQTLTNNGINVTTFTEVLDTFQSHYNIEISATESSTALIA